MLDATAGPDVGDPYWAPPPERPYLQEVGADPGRLRIAFTTIAVTDVTVHADCVQAVEDAAKLCSELGHVLEDITLPLNAEMLFSAFSVLWSTGIGSTIKALGASRDQVEPLTWALKEMNDQYSAADYLLAIQTLQSVSREIARFFQNYDVLLTPTLAEPPLPLGSFDSPPDNPMHGFYRSGTFACFTPLCNITGQPGMSLPLFWNAENLPVGTHFIGRFGDEATLFRLAAQLEQATLSYEAALAAYQLAVRGPTEADIEAARAQLAQAEAGLALLERGASDADLAGAGAEIRRAQAQLDLIEAGARPE